MNQLILAAGTSTPVVGELDSSVLEWTDKITNLAYIVAALLFILALAGLAKQESASRGNRFGIAGMTIALIATIVKAVVASENDPENFNNGLVTFLLIAVAMIIGAAIGIPKARKVEMTGMPELIAMLHCFVGLAAVLIGVNSFISQLDSGDPAGFSLGEIYLGIFIGAVTFTGSIVAYLKLSGKIGGAPLTLPGRNLLNLGIIVISLVGMGIFIANGGDNASLSWSLLAVMLVPVTVAFAALVMPGYIANLSWVSVYTFDVRPLWIILLVAVALALLTPLICLHLITRDTIQERLRTVE